MVYKITLFHKIETLSRHLNWKDNDIQTFMERRHIQCKGCSTLFWCCKSGMSVDKGMWNLLKFNLAIRLPRKKFCWHKISELESCGAPAMALLRQPWSLGISWPSWHDGSKRWRDIQNRKSGAVKWDINYTLIKKVGILTVSRFLWPILDMGISPFLHGWVIKLGVKCAGEDRGQSGKKYLKKLCSKQNLSPQGKLV